MIRHLMLHSCFLLLALAVVPACSTSSPTPDAPQTPVPDVATPSFSQAEQDAIATALQTHTPTQGGITLGVFRTADGATWFTEAGEAHAGTPMTSTTVLEVGSVTKQFTAALLLLAVDEGKLSLDDTLASHLPGYGADARITLRHLMQHTSGIPSYTSLEAFNADPQKAYTQAELVALFQHLPLRFAPGDAFDYSNSGYFLLGMVLEGVYGRAYDELLEDKLFTPLQMAQTGYCDRNPTTTPRAQGHNSDGPVASVHMSQPFAAGALCATAQDLMTWAQAWLTRGVVDVDLNQRGALNDGSPVFYSAGMFNGRSNWRNTVQHGGSIPGFTARISQVWASSPDDGVVVVSLSNHGSTDHGALANAIADVLLPALPTSTYTPTAAQLDGVAGTYATPGLPPIRILVVDGGLAAHFGDSPQLPLRHERDFDYAFDDANVRLRFMPDDDRLEFEQHGINMWMTRLNDTDTDDTE